MIEILVIHDSDYGNEILVWRDGERLDLADSDLVVVQVDPGAGWTYEDWQDSARHAFESGHSIAFRNAVFDAYNDPPSRKHIEGWPDEEED